MLALHLIQNCMVYINTLMIQKLLAQPHWQGKLTPRDYAALTPLIWEHMNPCHQVPFQSQQRQSRIHVEIESATVGSTPIRQLMAEWEEPCRMQLTESL